VRSRPNSFTCPSIERHNPVHFAFKAIMRRALVFSLFALSPLLTAAEKPDVLVVIADQWSPRYVSWDNKEVLTPHLDRIAREGMIFDACYTTSPVCMPARVSLLTGLYPHNSCHGLWGNAAGYFPQPDDAPMFRDIQRAGLTTAQIGKTHWTAGPAWHAHSLQHSASIMWRTFPARRTRRRAAIPTRSICKSSACFRLWPTICTDAM
jgi:hypothetical protein